MTLGPLRPSVSVVVPALTLAQSLHPQGLARAPRHPSLPNRPTTSNPRRHRDAQVPSHRTPISRLPAATVATSPTHLIDAYPAVCSPRSTANQQRLG